MNRITILGTGTSTGVPILGCACAICQSNDPRNKRLRTSALIELSNGKKVLIDATPDLRTQLLRERVMDLDGVIITHDHADHTHGMDDLRPFGFKSQKALPVFCEGPTAQSLRDKFPYIFQREVVFKVRPILGGGIPLLDLEVVDPGKVEIFQNDFYLHALPHGHTTTLGIQHSRMAFITDCQEIPESSVKKLRDSRLQLLFLDCLRYTPHSTHLHLERTLEYVSAIKPEFTVLIHMGHELEYLDLMKVLQTRGIKKIQPGVDGATFLYS